MAKSQEDEATSPVKTVLGTLVKATGPGHLVLKEGFRFRNPSHGKIPLGWVNFREGKVQKKEKKLTNVSFMYVCVAENGDMLVCSSFFPQQ